jgi:hypothetical protein
VLAEVPADELVVLVVDDFLGVDPLADESVGRPIGLNSVVRASAGRPVVVSTVPLGR